MFLRVAPLRGRSPPRDGSRIEALGALSTLAEARRYLFRGPSPIKKSTWFLERRWASERISTSFRH